jgi:hypothetical protein
MGDIMVDYFGENVHEEIAEERERERLEEENQSNFKPKFCVAFIDSDDDVVHMTLYAQRPNVASLLVLFEELAIDEEFGMDREFVAGLTVRIFQTKDGGDIMDIVDPKSEGSVNEV